MKILVTGAAGFIGFHTVKALLNSGHTIVGIDNISDYYCTALKYARLEEVGIERNQIKHGQITASHLYPQYHFIQCDITDRVTLQEVFSKGQFDKVVNLAAQVGVRYSMEAPLSYVETNIVGFFNVLDCCRQYNISHLVYASSSSVYGNNTKIPFAEEDRVDNPISLYAATKKADEVLAESYYSSFGSS